MLSKAERRALGKQAKAKRRAAKRRKEIMRYVGLSVAVLAVIAGVAWAAGAFSSKPGAAPPFTLDPALQTKPTVAAGAPGRLTQLNLETLIKGNGPEIQSGQNLEVNYVGVTYADGKEFDSSWKTGQPFKFLFGQGKVIAGWDQGLVGVTVGSRVQLDIPAAQAYGDNPTGGAPAGDLRFVIDVLNAT
jgi:peptidylprolyl isomerase